MRPLYSLRKPMSVVAEAELIAARAWGSPAMTQVDTWSGKIATVVAPAVSGRFEPAPRFWNPATGTYQTTPPTVLPGQKVGVVFYGKNTSSYRQRMRVDCNGRTGTTKVVDPGMVTSWEFQWDAPTTPGDIVVTAKLYAEYYPG